MRGWGWWYSRGDWGHRCRWNRGGRGLEDSWTPVKKNPSHLGGKLKKITIVFCVKKLYSLQSIYLQDWLGTVQIVRLVFLFYVFLREIFLFIECFLL